MDTASIKVVDLFSGVGGLSLGAARAGCHVAVAVENAPHAMAAHRLNFPTTKHLQKDAAQISGTALATEVGLKDGELLGVIGGPPCQGFSVIGHKSFDDPRNHLFTRFFQIVQDLQPHFFLAENVPGIMHEKNDELRNAAIALVRDDYALLDPIRVTASDFGVPTSRTRYLFIGVKTSHFETLAGTDIRGDCGPVTVRDAFAGLPTRVRSTWNTEKASWREVAAVRPASKFHKAVAGRIPRGVGDKTAIARLQDERLVSGFLGTLHESDVVARFAKVKPGGRDDVSKAQRLDWTGVCPTLRAGTGPERGSYQAVRPIHPTADRVITPREAARLQGFPDWFQFSPTKWHSFRQIGNSVCPPVAETVLRILLKKRRK